MSAASEAQVVARDNGDCVAELVLAEPAGGSEPLSGYLTTHSAARVDWNQLPAPDAFRPDPGARGRLIELLSPNDPRAL